MTNIAQQGTARLLLWCNGYICPGWNTSFCGHKSVICVHSESSYPKDRTRQEESPVSKKPFHSGMEGGGSSLVEVLGRAWMAISQGCLIC